LSESTARRIEAARPFSSIDDLATRAQIGTKEITLLAKAGALDVLEPDRRQAMWLARVPRFKGLLQGADAPSRRGHFKAMSRLEQLKLDFGTTGVSVSDHPMKLWRQHLPPHILSSAQVNACRDKERVVAAGLVICRQRPGTARGVVFMTLEDEYGFSNLVLYADTFERLFKVATGTSMLLAHGLIERAGDVVHLKVDDLEPLNAESFRLSRDFH
jgi:error-prone DNA polymerase